MVWFDGRLSTFKQKDLEHIALKAVRDGEASSSDHKCVPVPSVPELLRSLIVSVESSLLNRTLLDLLFTPGTYLLLAIHGLPAPHQAAGAAAAAAVSAPFAHPPPGHAAARPAQGWRANGSLSSAGLHESGAPEGNWARGGFRGGRGGPGRGGFGGRGGFENGHVVERNGFGAGDKSSLANRGEFGNRSQARVPAPNDGGRGDRGPDRGFNGGVGQGRGDNFASRGGAPSRAAERSDGWGERSGGWNERPASGRAESGWGGGRRDGPQSRSPSPPPRRRDYSPEPVKLRGGRRPSPTY